MTQRVSAQHAWRQTRCPWRGDALRLAADALRLAADALRLAEWLQSALAGDALRLAGDGDREGRRAVHAPSSCGPASP